MADTAVDTSAAAEVTAKVGSFRALLSKCSANFEDLQEEIVFIELFYSPPPFVSSGGVTATWCEFKGERGGVWG